MYEERTDPDAQPVEVAGGIYWVGLRDPKDLFHCNPYLLIDGDEAVLFDPGGVPDYARVAEKLSSLIDPARIRYVVLHHQDPDICAAVPLLEETVGPERFRIVTHSRASVIVRHYGVRSEFYLVDQNAYALALKSGRLLRFLVTPFCHFPAAIATYDEQEKVLFSSDLFGAIGPHGDLIARQGHEEQMRGFHVGYMASTRHLCQVMERLATLDLEMVLPQHGSLIPKEMIPRCIDFLKRLPCGIDALESEDEMYRWIPVAASGDTRPILIVEDDERNRKLLRDILAASGYVTIEADNGREAVELAERKQPRLILMDIQIPLLNGLEATRIIRDTASTRHIPIVALTAYAMSGDRERILDAGCDGYLSKPLIVQELLETIRVLLAE